MVDSNYNYCCSMVLDMDVVGMVGMADMDMVLHYKLV